MSNWLYFVLVYVTEQPKGNRSFWLKRLYYRIALSMLMAFNDLGISKMHVINIQLKRDRSHKFIIRFLNQ